MLERVRVLIWFLMAIRFRNRWKKFNFVAQFDIFTKWEAWGDDSRAKYKFFRLFCFIFFQREMNLAKGVQNVESECGTFSKD